LKETKPESSDKGKWFYSKGLEKVAVKVMVKRGN